VQRELLSRRETARLRWVAKQDDLSESVEDLPVLNEADQRQREGDWNETDTRFPHCPQDKQVHELFETQVERTRYAVALVYSKGEVSYRELDNQANRVAFHLRSLESGRILLSASACDARRTGSAGRFASAISIPLLPHGRSNGKPQLRHS